MVNVFPNPENTTDFLKQLVYINSLTDTGSGGILGTLFLVIIFSTLFMIQKAFSYDKALYTSALITSFLAILFRILNLTNDFILYLGIIGIIFSLWMLQKESSQGEI
jgi:hypothetical protein